MTRTRITRSPQRRRLAARGDAVLTSCLLPRPLHRRLRMASFDLNWTMAQLLREAATEWLQRHGKETR